MENVYYLLAIREAAPSSSEIEATAGGVRVVPGEDAQAAATSDELTKEAGPFGAVETSKGPIADVP